jgi:dynein heavy chain
MVIGETKTGKSTIIKVLKDVIADKPVRCEILNPKALSLAELYGVFNHSTQEWSDGVAS